MAVVQHKGSQYLYVSFVYRGRKVFRSARTSDVAEAEAFEDQLRKEIASKYKNALNREEVSYRLIENDDWKRRKLAQVKARSVQAGYQFNLSIDDFDLPSHCPILGHVLVYRDTSCPVASVQKNRWDLGPQGMNTPTMDRIDSSKGYVKGNVHIISGRANTLKRDATTTELRRIADYMDFKTVRVACWGHALGMGH